jgi:hypothetical protein
MQSAFHITTKVLPGNRVEIQLPSGSEGEEVDVFVILAAKHPIPDSQNLTNELPQMVDDPDIKAELGATHSTEALARIRSRPRVNPTEFGLPDSTILIRDDRNR